jgi:hypothetical protein
MAHFVRFPRLWARSIRLMVLHSTSVSFEAVIYHQDARLF